MSKNIICALILCLSVFIVQSKYTDQDSEWDVLIFSQHWPITVCKKWSNHGRHTCTLPKNENAWTIHGVWPTKAGTKGPNFCNTTWQFDITQLEPIMAQLEQSWINIDNGTAPDDLWRHEWVKHGTCAILLESLNSELRYFSKGLDWLQNYMIADILSLGNVLPSDDKEYKVTDFYLPIKKKLGKEPTISCKYLDGTQYIYELHICFTRDFQLTDCTPVDSNEMTNDSTDYITNCNSSQSIIYPRNVNVLKRTFVQF